jgi:hypothetical protein
MHADGPSGGIGVRQLAVRRVRGRSAISAARRGVGPRGLWAGRHEAEAYGAEQRPVRAARRQQVVEAISGR